MDVGWVHRVGKCAWDDDARREESATQRAPPTHPTLSSHPAVQLADSIRPRPPPPVYICPPGGRTSGIQILQSPTLRPLLFLPSYLSLFVFVSASGR